MKKNLNRCQECLARNNADEHGLAFCRTHGINIYIHSVACKQFDNVEPF